ncbi:VWA domain-containing protein [Rhodobacteraceae bacterium D3-12]|nr:VWA domain-containing protein [Rhodobacteraceae bacterium D3-12]
MRLFIWCAAMMMAAISPVSSQERAMIVLDASGSMWGQIDGKAKIEIARDTLGDVLGAVPEGNELGLIVYGHRRKGDCKDIELAVKAGKGTGGAIANFAKGISPKGKTPLSAAVKMAAEALRFTEDKATVILVTDGLETCDMDPCALGRELEAAGVDFTAHVVGFGLSKEEGAQVSCLAKATGGQYIEASSADTLGKALEQTVVVEAVPAPAVVPTPAPAPVTPPEPAKPEFNIVGTASLSEGGPVLDDKSVRWILRPIDENGKVINKPAASKYAVEFQASVPAGKYLLITRLEKIEMQREITLSETEQTPVEVVLNAGIVEITPKRTPDGEVEKAIRIKVFNGKFENGAYGKARFYVPAGNIKVTGRLAKAEASKDMVLAAGELLTTDIVVGSGVVMATALYSEGGPAVETNGIRYRVLSAKADLKGKRKELGGTYGSKPIELPVGEYIVTARLDKAEVQSQPIKVEAGQRTDVQLVLNAGVAAITAPGGYRIRILGKKNLQGERKELSSKYGEALSLTLTAGSYLVRVEYESDKAAIEQEVTVVAGERAEVTLQ